MFQSPVFQDSFSVEQTSERRQPPTVYILHNLQCISCFIYSKYFFLLSSPITRLSIQPFQWACIFPSHPDFFFSEIVLFGCSLFLRNGPLWALKEYFFLRLSFNFNISEINGLGLKMNCLSTKSKSCNDLSSSSTDRFEERYPLSEKVPSYGNFSQWFDPPPSITENGKKKLM